MPEYGELENSRASTALLIVDVQEKLFPFIHNHQELERSIVKVVTFCRRLGIPVFVTEQYPKGLGTTIPSVREAIGDAYKPIPKTVFSCFGSREFVDAIDDANVDVLTVVGIETHICVQQTALAGIWSDELEVQILADGVGSRKPLDHQIGIERLRDEGATIATIESFMYEILLEAKTDDHKKVFDLLTDR
ncbi:isochorismatase family protein [bacterium]|nr:isochorismatase family protein [bacterium]